MPMRRCAACNFWFTPASPEQQACPRCGQAAVETTQSNPARRVPIARAANWAEAGFFEEVLTRHQILPEMVEREDFDALTGCWHTQVVMLVPEADAQRAADFIECELRREDDSRPLPHEVFSPSGLAAAGPFWKPVFFMLIAGGLAYWVTVRGIAGPQQRRAAAPKRPTTDLWDMLSRSSRPWRQTLTDGSIRLLWRDAGSGSLHLKQDSDGDGRYDRWQEFRDGRKVRDVELTPFFSGPEPGF